MWDSLETHCGGHLDLLKYWPSNKTVNTGVSILFFSSLELGDNLCETPTMLPAQLTGAVKYTNFISAEE